MISWPKFELLGCLWPHLTRKQVVPRWCNPNIYRDQNLICQLRLPGRRERKASTVTRGGIDQCWGVLRGSTAVRIEIYIGYVCNWVYQLVNLHLRVNRIEQPECQSGEALGFPDENHILTNAVLVVFGSLGHHASLASMRQRQDNTCAM